MTAAVTNLAAQNFTSLIVYEDIIIKVDNNFENFTGYCKEEVYNKSVSTVLNELLKMRADVNGFEIGQQKGSFFMFTKHNEVKEIAISIKPGSDINIIVYSFIELSDARRLEEQFEIIRQQNEQLKSIIKQQENLVKSEIEKNQILEKMIVMKDEFLTTMSHEFKTPLNVINSAIQAMELLCWDEMSQRAKRYIISIKQNAFRQLRLVNNLLDITKVQSGKMKLYNKNIDIVFITKSIVESILVYAQQKRIKLDFASTIKEKTIGIDEEKYERILLNLLSNAIKFTPKDKQITVNLSSKKGYVCIEVKDNGVGIPKDKQKEIFERFGQVDSSLTRQAEGTGIGLSLVKLLVNALDGRISVESDVGKGSSFTVLLPNKKVPECTAEKTLQNLTDNRLIQSIAIEFSDIYFL